MSDNDLIGQSVVGALEGLMTLISASSYRMRTRQLMDLLSLVKTYCRWSRSSDANQKLLFRQRHDWDTWMVWLLSLDAHNDDAGACNQLVSQIAVTIVWRFLQNGDKGWVITFIVFVFVFRFDKLYDWSPSNKQIISLF